VNICMVGIGYVGLVSAACLSEIGHHVWCYDIDQEKIKQLQSGQVTIYEPGLKELVQRNLKTGKLVFENKFDVVLENCSVIILSVNTPPKKNGAADLQYVFDCAHQIGQLMTSCKTIVIKSTVPVGTSEIIREIIRGELEERKLAGIEFAMASCPEFLREGSAIDDFMFPDRIIVGADTEQTASLMRDIFLPIIENTKSPFYVLSIPSAELSKYAANAMLATRISFMNELAALCSCTSADIKEIRLGIGSDKRIGMEFLNAGVGYGGSCFPKDIKALIQTGAENGVNFEILKAVEKVNHFQKSKVVQLIQHHFDNILVDRKIAIWGLSFKPHTDDMRESPSIDTISKLAELGAKVNAYDPVAIPRARKIFGNNPFIRFFQDKYEVLDNADALVILTEWPEFQNPDFPKIKNLLNNPLIIDGRNQYDPKQLRMDGFQYYSIGR
jgi:UDPglucose 6-dehydrogenase